MKKLLQHITTSMDVDHKFLPLFQTGGTKKPIINNRAFEQNRMYGDFLTNNKLRSPEAIVKEIEDKEEVRKQIAATPPRREEGTIRAAGPRQSGWSKGWEALANPAEAFGYAVRGQRLPDNFSKGESKTSSLNTLTKMINPFAWVDSGIEAVKSADETVNNLADGEFEQAATSFLNTGLNTLGALPLLSAESKAAQQALGRFITTRTPVRNVHRLNPIAGKLNQYNRVVGRDAVDDIIASRLVRSGQGVKTEMPWGDKIKTFYRPTPYPSFSKGLPQQRYINQVIAEGQEPFVISTNRAMKVSNLGRHGKGSTMFPVDESGRYMRSFPASEVEVFQAVPHWLRGYRRVSVPGSASQYSLRNIRPGASIQIIGNMPTWRESFEAVSRQNNPNFNPDLYANSAYGMRPMSELPEHLMPKYIDLNNLKETGGIIEDDGGQWNHPGDITRIRSKNITMQGVPYPVYAIPNKGKGGIMYPGENYVFPEADYVDEYPMMQKNEVLPKAQNGFIGPLEEEDGETGFMRAWMSSPKYKEMLTKSTISPEEYKTIFNKRLDNINRPYLKTAIEKDDVLNQGNIASANIFFSPAQYASPFIPGSKYIPSEKIGYNVKYSPELFSPMSPLDKMSILVHERSHTTDMDFDDPYNSETSIIPAKDRQMIGSGDGLTGYKRYLKNPTEIRARLNELRFLGKEFGAYDPFNESINLEKLEQLNKQIPSSKIRNSSPYEELKDLYTPEEIVNLLNSVSKTSTSKINTAKNGGQHGGLDRWFAEKWVDVKTGKTCGRQEGESRAYPACRPSRRVSSETPKTSSEMSPSEKAKFKRTKTSSERIPYNHKRK